MDDKDSEKVFLGSDHAGYKLKIELLALLRKNFSNIEFVDCGCDSEESCDYPVYASKVCERVLETSSKGILICGSAAGMTIVANKYRGIFAAPVWNEENARTASAHNNANIICLGARHLSLDFAYKLVATWFKTPFEGGRHKRRIELIKKLEEKNG